MTLSDPIQVDVKSLQGQKIKQKSQDAMPDVLPPAYNIIGTKPRAEGTEVNSSLHQRTSARVTDAKGIARPTIEAIARANNAAVGGTHRDVASPRQSLEHRFPAYGGPSKVKKQSLRMSQELGQIGLRNKVQLDSGLHESSIVFDESPNRAGAIVNKSYADLKQKREPMGRSFDRFAAKMEAERDLEVKRMK